MWQRVRHRDVFGPMRNPNAMAWEDLILSYFQLVKNHLTGRVHPVHIHLLRTYFLRFWCVSLIIKLLPWSYSINPTILRPPLWHSSTISQIDCPAWFFEWTNPDPGYPGSKIFDRLSTSIAFPKLWQSKAEISYSARGRAGVSEQGNQVFLRE